MPTPTSSTPGSRTKKKRTTYDHAFKLKVVRAALERPQNNRIKPTCAWFPGIEPCQLRKWIRNLEAEARPGSSAHPTYPTYMPTAAPAKAQAKPKPMRVPKASHEPDVSALASQRTPRRAAAGAVARLRIVLHEHDDLDDEESEEDEATAEEEEEGSAMEGASDDGLSFGESPPSTPRAADGLAGVADWSRRVARCGQSTPPSKSSSDLYASDSPSEIKPIYRRAASTKAGRVQRYLLLSARAEPPKVFTHGAGGSPWFLPVDASGAPDGIDVSPQEWVDEWLSEVASEEGASE